MIKLVLSDVDGTLIPLKRGHASERTMRAIEQVREAGVRFGLSTGRDVMELRALFGGNDSVFDNGVLSNGKKIMADGRLARLTLLDNEGLERMASIVRDYPGTFVTGYPLESDETNPIYCIGASEDEIASFSKMYSFRGIIVDHMPDVQIIGSTIACPLDQSAMDEIKARGTQACPEFDFVQPAPHWADILPKGLNKGSALAMLLEELGISVDEVVVFGDADNDLAILSSVENAVAVANATPAAKAASKWHIGACEDDAVAEALEQIARSAKDGGVPEFMR